MKYLQEFANKHQVLFSHDGKGTCGFGRPCVGFTKDETWIAYNPHKDLDYKPDMNWDDLVVFPNDTGNYYPPDETPNAYHKHDCLAVLIKSKDWENITQKEIEVALFELWFWTKAIEKRQEVEIVEYETGATGIQAMFSGITSYAIKSK